MTLDEDKMSPETEHLTKILKASIRVLGLRYQDVEAKLGVAPGYLGRLFRGIMQLKIDHVSEIARAIGMEPDEIFQIAFPTPRNPPSVGALRLREMLDTLQPTPQKQASPGDPKPAPIPPYPPYPPQQQYGQPYGQQYPPAHESPRSQASTDEERIERIVLQVFEKFFSSIAQSAAGPR